MTVLTSKSESSTSNSKGFDKLPDLKEILLKVLKISIPGMINQLVMSLEMTIVILLASAMYSETDVAALGSATYLFWFDFSVLYFVPVGVSSIVSRASGRGDEGTINRISTHGLILIFLSQVLITLLYFLLLRDHVFSWLKLDKSLASRTHLILSAFLLTFPIRSLSWSISSVLMGKGRTDKMTLVTLSAIIPEALVLWLGFSKEAPIHLVLGLSYLIGSSVSLVFSYYLYTNEGLKFKLSRRDILNDWQEIARIGIPSALTSIIFSFIYLLMLPIISSFGKSVLAALTVAQRIESTLWMVAWGLYPASVALIGQAIGGNKINLAKLYLRVIVWYGFVGTSIVSAVLIFKGFDILRLLTPSVDVAIHAYSYLFYTSIAAFFMLLEAVFAGVIVAIGRTLPLLVVDSTFNLMRLPLLWILCPKLGPDGIWIAINLSNLFKGVSLSIVGYQMLSTLKGEG